MAYPVLEQEAAAATPGDLDRSSPERVLVLAPLGRDALVLCRLLSQSGIESLICHDADAVAAGLAAGAGAVILTEESLSPRAGKRLAEALAAEPAWSDPTLLLLADGPTIAGLAAVAALRARSNLTVLERPTRALALVTAVEAALRARRRQYEIRDLIEDERKARVEAEAANRVKDEFLANVSHELRTPIGAVLLWTRLLARGKLPPDQRGKALESIEQCAVAQERLVTDLLDATRLATGRLRLDLRDCDPAASVAAAVAVVRPLAAAKGVGLTADLGATAEVVRADVDRLQQVVTNLIDNAVKFTPPGGQVAVQVGRLGNCVRIQVADTGEGIRPGFLPHVFERFTQDVTATAPRESGLGLGLAIVRDLVAAHGGSVAAESPGKGQGATISLCLPATGPGRLPRGGSASRSTPADDPPIDQAADSR